MWLKLSVYKYSIFFQFSSFWPNIKIVKFIWLCLMSIQTILTLNLLKFKNYIEMKTKNFFFYHPNITKLYKLGPFMTLHIWGWWKQFLKKWTTQKNLSWMWWKHLYWGQWQVSCSQHCLSKEISAQSASFMRAYIAVYFSYYLIVIVNKILNLFSVINQLPRCTYPHVIVFKTAVVQSAVKVVCCHHKAIFITSFKIAISRKVQIRFLWKQFPCAKL